MMPAPLYSEFSASDTVQVAGMLSLLAAVVAAAWIDRASHRIPNVLVLGGTAVAVLTHLAAGGASGLLPAGAGFATGLGLMLPFYLLKVMGAGDVKLMAMVGAFLGPVGVTSAALLTFLCGGVLALGFAVRHRALAKLWWNIRVMLLGTLASAITGGRASVDAPAVSVGRLAYGIAIATGTIAHVVMQWAGTPLF